MKISFDNRGREILSDVPAQFVLPDQRRISTLDFHRQRLLEQREAMRSMLEQMREDEEHETFAEANDFRVADPFDPESEFTDYELDDDNLDGLEAVAREVYNRSLEEASRTNRQNMNASTAPTDSPNQPE